MKKILLLTLTALIMVGCSHKPPQPYGTPFPINHYDAQEKNK